MVVSKETSCKPYLFMIIFSSIDYNVFVNISILKSPIITVGQFVSVFSRIGFKIEMK